MLSACIDGGTAFRVDLSALPALAEQVASFTRGRFPDLRVPFHARWRHFDVGGIARSDELDQALSGRSADEILFAKFDLAVVSVLLDAGAGAAWHYRESETTMTFSRSEGLAVASIRAFLRGDFSADARDPLRVDAARLLALGEGGLGAVFQVTHDNPLDGLEGRTLLLRGLASALSDLPHASSATAGRPALLAEALIADATADETARGGAAAGTPPPKKVRATRILLALLSGLAPMWPGRVVLDGENLGDVWPYPPLGTPLDPDGYVPLHKLSQWMAYSLIEPLEARGIAVTDIDELTGLAEYRNGGLLLDSGVLAVRDPSTLTRDFAPADRTTVEWRALTVALVERLAPMVRDALGVSAQALPLASILEGGTWALGRKLAGERRPRATPPLSIVSDGTVF
jgi:hypothetical protein